MVRKGELTVQGTEAQTSIEPQSKKITKGRGQQIAPVPSAFAVVIEQLEIAFDEDLRLAIFERLIREQQQIAQQVTEEEKLTKAVEIARLEAIEQAREKGKKSARAEIAQRKRQKLAAVQKQFIDVDLEKLIDSCNYLPYETMKQTIDGFAAQVGVKLEWRDLDDGQFECIPSIA
jgi:outer membrane translocation and assembly module TamA